MSASDFLREAESLRRLLSKEEREAIRRQDLRETFSEFQELNDQLHLRLRADIMKVQQQLQKLKNGVFRFQQQLMDTRPSPEVVDRLRDTMTDIETSINMFKDTQHQSLEQLLKDERVVWQEIGVLERRMEAWRVAVRAEVRVPDAGPDRRSADTHSSVPAELAALDSFLQRTGPRGGWDELDHRSFLSVWTKHSGKHSFIREAGLYLPGKSEEELKQHELWFLELRRLQHHKRQAIQRWRQAKQRERDQQERAGAEPEQEQEQERLKQEQERRRREASERLENWRSRRTQEREQEQEQRLREQILQRRRDEEEQRRRMEMKMRVQALLQQKKEEEEQRLMEEEEKRRLEREERQREANQAIRHFQDRDSVRLEEKLQEKQSKEQERRERQRMLEKLKEKVEVEVSRDPSRLWRRTEVWEQRMRNIGPSGSGPAPLTHTRHRAVPAWRQDS